MTSVAYAVLVSRMPCCALGAPSGCAGDVVAHGEGERQVPLCGRHQAQLLDLTGPWKSESGAAAWLAGMREVIRARVTTSEEAASLFLEEGGTQPQHKRREWIDWNAVRAGQAKAPTERMRMSFDSTDQHSIVDYSNGGTFDWKTPRKTHESGSNESAKKTPSRWSKMPWWMRKKLKGQAS